MATDEELDSIYLESAADELTLRKLHIYDVRENITSLNAVGLRAVYNAGLARALEIAREEKFVIARVAAAIEAERGQ